MGAVAHEHRRLRITTVTWGQTSLSSASHTRTYILQWRTSPEEDLFCHAMVTPIKMDRLLLWLLTLLRIAQTTGAESQGQQILAESAVKSNEPSPGSSVQSGPSRMQDCAACKHCIEFDSQIRYGRAHSCRLNQNAYTDHSCPFPTPPSTCDCNTYDDLPKDGRGNIWMDELERDLNGWV